jgi:hypothetical protein
MWPHIELKCDRHGTRRDRQDIPAMMAAEAPHVFDNKTAKSKALR